MLQKLNERIQGVIAWVVIILIAATFTLFGVDYYMQSRQVSDVEVSVNGEAISKHFFDTSYRRNRQQKDPSLMTAASDAALRKQVLNEMVVNLISVQGAKAGGFHVSVDQANQAIVNIPQFQQDGRFSSERYKQALSGAMFTPDSFRKEVQQGMLLNQQRFAFIGSAFAIPSELQRFVKLYMQTRNYQYLQIPAVLFLNKESISDVDVNAYYTQHQEKFLTPEKVIIQYIRLSMQQIKDTLKVSDEDIKRYYEENQSNFLTPAQWQVAHILFAVPEGADEELNKKVEQNAEESAQALQNNPMQFGQWVKTMSADKLSSNKDGVLPWMTAGQTEFDPILLTLTKPGQISKPFKTSHGYEIFKLVAYKPAQLKPLASVKSQISEQLVSEMAQTQYTQALEQLTDLSFQTPDTLNPVADALKLTIEKSEAFPRQGGNTELTKNKQIINAAFSHEVMELGNNSEPVQLDSDSVIVLRIDQHIDAAKKSLPAVKQDIINLLALKQAQEQAKKWGTTYLLTKNDERSTTVNGKKLEWRSVEEANRDSEKADAMINDLAFSLTKPNRLEGRRLLNGDYVIVHLKKITDGDYDALDKEQQNSLIQQIESSYGLVDYDLYIKSLENQAKVEPGK